MQDCMSSNKIKENKYKILRMSLILGSDDDKTETLNNFEEAAREIDAMNDEIYLKDLEDKFYDTLKLEEEEKKLDVLVDYIGGRVEQRISLLSDFANITGYDLTNLPPIKYYDKLDDYKDRLKYIREYLGNTEQINSLNQEIEQSEKELKEAYATKKSQEDNNSRNEEILLNKFRNIIKTVPELREVNEDNLEDKLSNIMLAVKDSKKSLDIFNKSFTTLSGSGISIEEEQEYKSYVDNAKDLYYQNKEQEYLLRLYQYLLIKENEYVPILRKRQQVNTILFERLDLRKTLEIETNDTLAPLYDLLEKQYDEIEHQRENINNIEFLNRNIENKKDILNELEQDNQKVEILSLLREFCLIDTYVDIEVPNSKEIEEPIIEPQKTEEKVSIPEQVEVKEAEEEEEEINDIIDTKTIEVPEPVKEETVKEEPIVDAVITPVSETPEPNEVISLTSAIGIDLDLVHSKANKVMKRVGEMLGVKTEETKVVSVIQEDAPISQKELPKIEKTDNEPKVSPISFPTENPLFNNTLEETTINTPQEEEKEEDNSFWFPSDTPDALNELPDLNVTNDNFFNGNTIPNLNFPDLKLDFGNNDSEEK